MSTQIKAKWGLHSWWKKWQLAKVPIGKRPKGEGLDKLKPQISMQFIIHMDLLYQETHTQQVLKT